MKTITGLVTNVTRVGSSRNGNPTMDVTLSTPTEGFPGEVTLRTHPDAAIAGSIENSEYADIPHVFAITQAGKLAFEVREAGWS